MCSTVEDFRSRIATQVDVTRRASRSYRTAESFGLVKQTNAPVVFWFERYQEGDNL
ncbi:HNH endonuclease, partial [Escherichia coli]